MSDNNTAKRSSLPMLIPQGDFAKSPPIKLGRPVFVLGSKDRCRIKLLSSTVSTTHALLVQTRHTTYIRDLCSRTHVFVNGKQVKEAELNDGDLIAIGKFTLKYQGPKNDHGSEVPPEPAALEVSGAQLPIPIEARAILIGRRPTCDIPLLEASVATVHAVIFAWEGKRFLRDLWSRTGTFVNGKPVHEREIQPGDVIRCGDTEIKYSPSLGKAAFSVVEGASDSIVTAAPGADAVDLGLELAPHAEHEQAPLEAIIPPLTPPKQEELLPQEPLEPELIESSPHDTAHVPLAVDAEKSTPVPAEPVAPLEITLSAPTAPVDEALVTPTTGSQDPLDFPKRGWRSAIQEAQEEPPVASTAPVVASPTMSEPEAPLVVESVETEPTPTEPPSIKSAPAEPAPTAAPVASESDIDNFLELAESSEVKPEVVVMEPVIPELVVPELVVPEPVVTEPVVTEPAAPVAPAAEILAATEPTPESALDLPITDEPVPVVESPAAEMTDTTFGRSIDEFEGESLGPIIETPERVEPTIEVPALEPSSTSDVISPDVISPDVMSPEPMLAASCDAIDLAATVDESIIVPERPIDTTKPLEPMDLDLPANTLTGDAAPHEAMVEASANLPEAPVDAIEEIPASAAADSIDPIEPTQINPIEEPAEVPAFETPAKDTSTPVPATDDGLTLSGLDSLASAAESQTIEPPAIENPTESLHALVEAASAVSHDVPQARDAEFAPLPDEAIAIAPEPSLLDDEQDVVAPDAPLTPDDTAMTVLAPEASATSPVNEEPAVESLLPIEPIELPTVESPAPAEAIEALTATTDHSSLPILPFVATLDASPGELSALDLTKLSTATEAPAADVHMMPAIEHAPIEHATTEHTSIESARSHAEAPITIEESLDFSKLTEPDTHAAPLDESSALGLLNYDEPASREPVAPVLSDTFHPAPTPAIAESLVQPADIRQAPTDDLAADTAEDALDLSVADTVAPIDESAAAFPTLPQPDAPAQTPVDEHLSVSEAHLSVSEPALSPEPEHHVTIDSSVEIPTPPAAEPDTMLSSSTATRFPDLLPPNADDAIAAEPLITEASSPVPPPMVDEREVKAPGARIRPRRKSRVIRNAFGQDPDAPKGGAVVIPPFASAASGLGEGMTLSGLSMAPVREADVFSEIHRSAASNDDPLSGQSVSDEDVFAKEVAKSLPVSSLTGLSDQPEPSPVLPLGEQPRRPRSRNGRPGVPMAAPRAPVAFADEGALSAATHRPKNLFRRVLVMMVVMLLLIGGAWAFVYQFVPVKTALEGKLTYKRFSNLIRKDAVIFVTEQNSRLNEEATRILAIRKLQELHPGTPPGFLADPTSYASIETNWPGDPMVGELHLRYDGTDPRNDKARLGAVLQALYEANSGLVDDAYLITKQYDDLQKRVDTNTKRINDLSTEIEIQRAKVDNAPGDAQIKQLQATKTDLDNKQVQLDQQLKDAQAELDKLKQQKTAAMAAANADPTANDAEIQQMTKDAAALSARVADARKVRADMATQARETLDAAYDEFKKQLDSSQGIAKDNPQLAAYFSSAQSLQQALRVITDQYIQKQQQEYTALNQLKDNFVAKMTDKKATLLANDPKLKELNDRREIDTRKYNEAVNSGLDREAGDLKNELKMLDSAIAAQQDVVANDPIYNDLITSLQQMIDQKQKSINDEKARTDQKLADLLHQFNKSASGVQNLPAEQKELATAMHDKLAAIDAARKQYAEASDASAADADTSIKNLNAQLQALQTNLEARKKQLASANSPEQIKVEQDQRDADIAAKAKLVEDLSAQLADAQTAAEGNRIALAKAQDAKAGAKAADDLLQADLKERDALTITMDQHTRDRDKRQDDAKRAIEPAAPTPDDVRDLRSPVDNRLAISACASGGIFVLFAIWIMLTLLGAAKQTHYSFSPAIETLETSAPTKMEEEPVVA